MSDERLIRDLEASVVHDQALNDKELSPSEPRLSAADGYEDLFQLLEEDVKVVFVTGKAGTGKSTLIRHIKKQYPNSLAIVAPTGIAALNVGGMTIHSFFSFPHTIIREDDIKLRPQQEIFKALRFLIVDEVSMVRADVMDGIDRFLRLNGPQNDQPFGGVKLILVGDLLQLAPVVGKDREEKEYFSRQYKTPFFFSAKSIGGLTIREFATYRLTKTYRQNDPSFVELLSRIRTTVKGQLCDDDLDSLNTRHGATHHDAKPVMLVGTNKNAANINASMLAKLPTPSIVFEGSFEGDYTPEEKDPLPSPKKLELKVGARVMFTKNDAQKRWVNGLFGTVCELDADRVVVMLDGCPQPFMVARESWVKLRPKYDRKANRLNYIEVGSYTQFPITLAWAITIHKSQGKTLQGISLNLAKGAFAGGQTYVALSRVRSMENIILDRPLRKIDVYCDDVVSRFESELFEAAKLGHGTIADVAEQAESLVGENENGGMESENGPRNTNEYVRNKVNMAIRAGLKLEINYIDASAKTSTRTVRPIEWNDGAETKFIGYCEKRNDERCFVVDGVTVLDVVE